MYYIIIIIIIDVIIVIMVKVEDGRDGGNPEFEGDVQDQYQDEVGDDHDDDDHDDEDAQDQYRDEHIYWWWSSSWLKGFPHDASAPLEHVSSRGRDVHHKVDLAIIIIAITINDITIKITDIIVTITI